jgi:hypothetical protein
VGGLPARIFARVFPICKSGCAALADQLLKETPVAAGEDEAKAKLKLLVAHAEREMQSTMDELYKL